MNERKVICRNCGRPFPVWDIHSKKITCPFCDAEGKNPLYVAPVKISPNEMFVVLEDE